MAFILLIFSPEAVRTPMQSCLDNQEKSFPAGEGVFATRPFRGRQEKEG